MALRDRREDLAAAWQGWPAWRRRLFVTAALSSIAFAAWIAAGLLVGSSRADLAVSGEALPDVASAIAPAGERGTAPAAEGAESGAGVALRDSAREAALERSLAAKARTLLERVVGEGRVAVEVRADLDWSRREATQERFDPEGQVERSEERATEPAGARAAGRVTERVEYDVSKEVTREVVPGGSIRRLHVAVLLDQPAPGTEAAGAAGLASLEELAKQAVGFSAARGDVFSLATLPFHEAWPMPGPGSLGAAEALPLAGLILAAVLAGFALLRPQATLAAGSQLPMTAAALEAALLQGAAPSRAVDAGDDVAGTVGAGAERDAAAAALRAWLEVR